MVEFRDVELRFFCRRGLKLPGIHGGQRAALFNHAARAKSLTPAKAEPENARKEQAIYRKKRKLVPKDGSLAKITRGKPFCADRTNG